MEQSRSIQVRTCPRGSERYTWQEGDTASSVALQHATTVQALSVINPGVDFATLTAGSEICLPFFAYTCISGRPYTVQSGDTFAAIAQRLGITTYELAERNPGVSPDSLTPGQILCVPATADEEENDSAQTPVIPLPDENEGTPIPDRPLSCPVGYTAATVQPGESYADLLIRHNVSYRAMRSSNPQLQPGYLVSGTPYCAPPAGTRQLCTASRSYTIRPEETLDSLAASLRTTRGRLLALNPTLLPSDFSSGTIICIE